MPRLYGKDYTPEDLRQMTGTLQQLAGIRLVELADGKPRGMRVAEVWNASGFRFQVLIDRAMDIGAASFQGKALAWQHPALATSAHYEPTGAGWLRTWGGGMMTTCGLNHFGPAQVDGNELLGVHGRVGHIPAERVSIREAWEGDDYVLSIEGRVRQAVLFGENLLLTRRISTRLGASSLLIEDTVRNDGYRPTPHMVMYHCNFGFPVVSPDSYVEIDDEAVWQRDEAAAKGLETHDRFERPQLDYPEQVFYHQPRVNDGMCQAAIVNPSINFGGYVRWRAAELPYMVQWKQLLAGEYVCGLEPVTYHETNREKLRAEGKLRLLAPGEEVHYRLEIGVFDPR